MKRCNEIQRNKPTTNWINGGSNTYKLNELQYKRTNKMTDNRKSTQLIHLCVDKIMPMSIFVVVHWVAIRLALSYTCFAFTAMS